MKDRAEAADRVRGLFNIAVTPFHEDGGFDFAALEAHLERIIGLGFDGILVGGTYGEFPAMTASERATLFRRAMAVVGDRVPVMLCSASSDVRVARELTILAGELGGLPMLTAPYVSEVTGEQILAFFREMAPLSRTGFLVYNAPGIGITLPPSLLVALADIDGAVGIKQGDLTPAVIDEIAGRLAGRLRLFCASDLAFLGPLMAGFDGLSSTNSCALSGLILSSFRAAERGDAATARELHRRWYGFREIARRYGQPQTTKAAMRHLGLGGGHVRPPLRDLDATQIAAVSEALERIGETESPPSICR